MSLSIMPQVTMTIAAKAATAAKAIVIALPPSR
jgi:hypothetical protein